MKTKNIIALSLISIFCSGHISCSQDKDILTSPSIIKYPVAHHIPLADIEIYNAFTAGIDGIHSYRIPSLVTAKNGDLLLFCEARKVSWGDKSPTDLVLKISKDNGATWSAMEVLLSDGSNAFMDPVATVDKVTGRIFLFACRWPAGDVSMQDNTGWMCYSDDNGATWSVPQNVTDDIVPNSFSLNGFGPGSGIQMNANSDYPDRLIVPIRVYNGSSTRNRVLYSDDHGVTWELGQEMTDGGEFQIAESPNNTLIYNRRGDATRYRAFSEDGGISWTKFELDIALRSVAGGCQGSIWGQDSVLFYTGPAGGPVTSTTDNRSNFMIYRSLDGGLTWNNQQLLYNKAAGYSCITQMNNGDFAVVFESADTQGFTRTSVRGYNWMRLDVIVIPKEILDKDYWF
ncbi:exo-alpha-sialidase [Sphingobacterium sp. SGG-5]|uniref:sialidase family protein n=1 Tax=Sphingobacterium sp. SGG-5 TaxID=2710881 RepID=UPI0013EE23A6|nr:sialidase family protein [Sphingobacterium sp. SGG-5]NGM61787.1 exo-alpha-sialidase [Sphingobacterium sp. SGG-5]